MGVLCKFVADMSTFDMPGTIIISMKKIYTLKKAVMCAALLAGCIATGSSKVVYIEQGGVRYY